MMDLQALALETTGKLSMLWDSLGISQEEREDFMSNMMEEVKSVYTRRFDEQSLRLKSTEDDIAQLKSEIEFAYKKLKEEAIMPQQNNTALLPYRAELEELRNSLNELLESRLTELKKLESDLKQLSADVGADIDPAFVSIGDHYSLARISAYGNEISRLAAIKDDRTVLIHNLCTEILNLWMELGFGPKDQFESYIPKKGEGLGWTDAVITHLKEKVNALNAEKIIREEKITVIGTAITTLWKRLATSEEEQTAFLEAHAGIGDDVIKACEDYLTKKQAEFAAKLVDLIANVRGNIQAVWTEMRFDEAQKREAFAPFFAGPEEFSDDLFLTHEAYYTQALSECEQLRPVLRAIEKREALLADKEEYDSLIADPNRLIKGSSAARLNEEKLERRVKKELPAVTKRLREQLAAYEASTARPLLIDGKHYLTMLDDEEAAEMRAREAARANRRGGLTGLNTEDNASFASTSRQSLMSRVSAARNTIPGGKIGSETPGKKSAPLAASNGTNTKKGNLASKTSRAVRTTTQERSSLLPETL